MSRVNEAGQPIGKAVAWTARPEVEPVTLVGEWCRLEPWSHVHLDALYDATVVSSPPTLWTYLPRVPPRRPDELADWLDGLAADPAAVPLVICRPDGRAVGTASYLRLDGPNGSVEVGAIAYAAELQRTTAATEAMYLMARHVFDELGYRRYEWKCDSLNAPSRKAAQRLGFRYEGTFRNAMVYKDRNRDTDWFSITDGEWPEIRDAFEDWLAPTNQPGGVQQRPLAVTTG